MSFAIREAAVAVAVAKCWLARTPNAVLAVGAYHPKGCGWDIYTREDLIAALEGYWSWSGSSRDAEEFARQPREVQRRLVREAQGVEA